MSLQETGDNSAKLLSLHGAARTFDDPCIDAEFIADHRGHQHLLDWLRLSKDWNTPLHHLDLLDADHTLRLLRDGADLYACAHPGAVTPLDLAQRRLGWDASELVLLAAQPWSAANHHTFPVNARRRARDLLLLGYCVSIAMGDVWRMHLLPGVVFRDT